MKIGVAARALAAVGFGLIAALPASQADATSDQDEIRALQARLKKLEEKVAKQEKAAKEAKKAEKKEEKKSGTNIVNVPAAAADKGGVPAPPPVFVSFKNGLFVETADHAYSFKVGGRIFIDAGGSTQPEGGRSGNAGIRRARLEVEGKAATYWFYKLQYDFAGNNQPTTLGSGTTSPIGGMRDAYLGIQHPWLLFPYARNPAFVMIGNQYEPASIEALTSSKYIDFIERALPVDAYAPFRHIGIGVGAYGDNWTAKYGVYSASPEDRAAAPGFAFNYNPWAVLPRIGAIAPAGIAGAPGFASTGGGNYLDVTGRVTYAPIWEKEDDCCGPARLLHFGAWARYHRPNESTSGNDDRVLALGSNLRSEENIVGENLTGTPDLSCGTTFGLGVNVYFGNFVAGHCTRDVTTFGLEGVGSWGPVSIQGEYMNAHYNRNVNAIALANFYGPNALPAFGLFQPTNGSANFNGFYVYSTLYLTGEERAEAYNVRDRNGAAFEQIKIKRPFSEGGWGALEVAMRYSDVNFDSGPFGGVRYGGLVGLGVQTGNIGFARAIANSSIVGGKQQDLTAGVNWYPDRGFRFMLNWTRVMALSAPFDRPWLNGAHPNIFEIRAQVDW